MKTLTLKSKYKLQFSIVLSLNIVVDKKWIWNFKYVLTKIPVPDNYRNGRNDIKYFIPVHLNLLQLNSPFYNQQVE